MTDAGARVIRLADAPEALRGEIRRRGDPWHRTAGSRLDTLVLADRLLPQAFVLRGLGLTDARPGVPAPADGDGRLALEGLWAAGCSVHPSLRPRLVREAGPRWLEMRPPARLPAPSNDRAGCGTGRHP